tara:strand:+ start:514 stop:2220 length:1707 start_codon:yes stop_codon:yes gene_type:complete
MATQKDIALNIKVKFEGANTVQELEDVLKEINKEMENVDQNSHAFAILKNTASKATDEVQELNTKIQDLNGQTKTVKGGMEGLKGSTELVTQANGKLATSFEDVTSNGGAIAVLDSLTGGLATKIKDAFEASKLFNFSLKGMRTALISTGIGVFVVALGLAVAYWDDIKDAILGTTKSLEGAVERQRFLNQQLEDELDLLDKQQKLLELQGKSTVNITAEKRKTLLLQRETNIAELKSLENLLNHEILREKQFTLGERLKFMAISLVNTYGAQGERLLDTIGFSERTLEIQQQIKTAQSETLDIDIALAQIEADRKKAAEGTTKAVKEEVEAKNQLKDITADEEAMLDADIENDPFLNMLIQRGAAIIDEKEKQALEQKELEQRQFESSEAYETRKAARILEIEQNAAQARKDLAANLYFSLVDLAQTFFEDTEEGQKKAFEFNKQLSIAETLVSTYLAAQKAYTSQLTLTPDSPIRAAIAAGVAVASGLARVAAIQRTQFNSPSADTSAGGGGGSTLPNQTQNTSPVVPIINVGENGQLIKVYVSETDIRKATRNVNSIYQKAIVTE